MQSPNALHRVETILPRREHGRAQVRADVGRPASLVHDGVAAGAGEDGLPLGHLTGVQAKCTAHGRLAALTRGKHERAPRGCHRRRGFSRGRRLMHVSFGRVGWRGLVQRDPGVFSDAAGRVATRVSRGGRPMAKGGGNNSIRVGLGRKAKNSLARTGHQRGMGGRDTEETLRRTPHRKPCQQSSGNVRKSHIQRKNVGSAFSDLHRRKYSPRDK